MASIKIFTEVSIQKPIAEVWEYFNNPEKMRIWISGLTSFKMISGTRGTVGATAQHTYEMRGIKMEMIEKTTAVNHHQSMSATLGNEDLTSLLYNEFRSIDANTTQINGTVEITLHAFLLKMASTIVEAEMRTRMKSDMQNLKVAIEAGS